MRRILMLTTLAAFLFGSGAVAQDEGPKVKVQSGGATIVVDENGKLQVEKFGELDHSEILDQLPAELREKVKKALQLKQDKNQGHGGIATIRGIFIGPDGVKKAFGDGKGMLPPKKMFESLPKEVRQQIEKAMKEHGVKGNGAWAQPGNAGDANVDVDVEIKGVIIGPDGKKREIQLGAPDNLDHKKLFEGLPKNIREQFEKAMKEGRKELPRMKSGITAKSVNGKAIIIGPDGKQHELNIGEGGFKFDQMFKNMPKETQKTMMKALENANWKTLPPIGILKPQSDATNQEILDKLEQMQKQINEIRKRLDE